MMRIKIAVISINAIIWCNRLDTYIRWIEYRFDPRQLFETRLIGRYISLSSDISSLFTYIWYTTLLANLNIDIRYLWSSRMICSDLLRYWIVSYDGIDWLHEFLLISINDFRISTTWSLNEKIENYIISYLESDFSWPSLYRDCSSRLDFNSNSWSKLFIFFHTLHDKR